MTDQPAVKINEFAAWQEWETISLQTNQAYPEIGLLTLNRPEKLNAINDVMMDDMHACLSFLEHAFDCRVLIICGAGKLFCSGVDLTTMGQQEENFDWEKFPERIKQFWQAQHEISSIYSRLRRIPQPVIAAVHRAAVGGGMAFANCSDIVIASRNTKFINAFIKIGLSGADCGSSYFLPRILGFHRSAELMYTGRDLMAEEAFQWGYVNVLVDDEAKVVPKAVEFAAEHMLTKSPLGLRLTKEALNFNIDATNIDAAIKFEDRNQVLGGQSQDMMEGVMSFFEKRKPKYGPR